MSYASDASYRVRLRMRGDLLMQHQRDGQRSWWVVKDPVSLQYFQLYDEEAAVLQLLDGQRSFEAIRRQFERTFAPRRLTPEGLGRYLAQLHRCGLVTADVPGQGAELKSRRDQQRRSDRLGTLAGVLWLRFRGVDPEPLLNGIYPKVRWLFSPWLLMLCCLSVVSAVALVLVRVETLQGKLPSLQAFFDARNVLWLVVVLAGVKVLHELGHALCCKHFGGECHEIGVMLFCGVPFLYCNVSDAWRFPDKWQRIAVSAAGMAVEIVLASICTWVWILSEPGFLNTLCLNLAVVCSARTLLFNGNPLLRYDGYYILSDLGGLPNLYQRSSALVGRTLARWCAGLNLPATDPLPPGSRGWVLLYGLASAGYRVLIVVTIVWLSYTFLKPYGLQTLAAVVGGLLATRLLLWSPVRAVVHLFHIPGTRNRMSPVRLLISGCLALAVAVTVLAVPLPLRVVAPARLEPANLHRVYVTMPGNLKSALAAGTAVRRGQMFAELEDPDVEMQVAVLAGERNRQQLRLNHLELRRVDAPELASRIPAERAALLDIEARLRQRQRDQEGMAISSPADGIVFPPPERRETYTPGRLNRYVGSPLELRSRGCFLPSGTLLCLVGDPARMEAVLLIEQADVGLVEQGQPVRLCLEETPGSVIRGTVTAVSSSHVEILPDEFYHGGMVARRLRQREAAPLETMYEARVTLQDRAGPLLMGTRGYAKILAEPLPLWRRIYRYAKRTFGLAI